MAADQPTSDDAHPKVVCALVLLDDAGDALLQLRDDKPGIRAAGRWVFPGGHADSGEDIFDCARREFREETDYSCGGARWLLTIEDAFLDQPAQRLHVFWDRYVPDTPYACREGQALEFIERQSAESIGVPAYIVAIWDLARLATSTAGGAQVHPVLEIKLR